MGEMRRVLLLFVLILSSGVAGAQTPDRNWQISNVLPDFGRDSYGDDEYERVAALRADMDVVRAGLDLDWLYIELDCKSAYLGNMDYYAIEIDNDPLVEQDRGDWFIFIYACDAIADTAWTMGRNLAARCDHGKARAYRDNNDDVGWLRPTFSEFPRCGNGYDHEDRKKADSGTYFRVIAGNLQIAAARTDFGVDSRTRIRAWVYQEQEAKQKEQYLHDKKTSANIVDLDNSSGVGTLKWTAATVTLESYLDSLREQKSDYFSGDRGSFVYIRGRNYSITAPYAVAFYDATGELVGIDSCFCDASCALDAEYRFGTAGTRSDSQPWHACVYFVGRSIPVTLQAVDRNRASLDSFYVFERFGPYIINTEIDTTDSDVVITWVSVNGLYYDVLYSNSLQGLYQTAWTVQAADTISSWDDDGSNTGGHPSTVAARFYKVRLTGGSMSPNTVGKVSRDLTNDMSLVSVPLVPCSSSIQDVLRGQLIGAPDEGYADRIWKWNPVTMDYEFAWLVDGVGDPYDHKWWCPDPFGPSQMSLSCGEGFWIESRHGPQTVTFVGKVFDDSFAVIDISWPMQLIGSPYPDTVMLVDCGLKESGATGRPSELFADRIWFWDESAYNYDYAWLVDSVGPAYDGKWWDSDPWGETTIAVKPCYGYWFQLRNNLFAWRYAKPYDVPPNR
jgi:hypothetical protein